MSAKIDVHSHFLPLAYRQACIDNGHSSPDGMPFLPEWSEEAHLHLMDTHGIEKSIISISTPGTNLVYENSELAAQVTRDCNVYASQLKKRMPHRFGYWASLPIPDVELCLSEITKCADEGCDGYVLLTNGHGHYLGDPIFDSVFDELNRRRATIFIHPTTPCVKCRPSAAEPAKSTSQKPTPAAPLEDKFPNPMLEFLFDTARVVSNLFLSGTIARCPDLKIILPHLGGATPPLLSRWTTFSVTIPGSSKHVSEEEVRVAFNRQFWFDLAGVPFPGQIVGLLKGVGVSHTRLLYGSDFPYTSTGGVAHLFSELNTGLREFNEEEAGDMLYGNAQKFLSEKMER